MWIHRSSLLALSTPLLLSSLFLLLLLLTSPPSTTAARTGDFKKCQDSSFCRRLRRLSDYVADQKGFASPYSLLLPESQKEPQWDETSSTLTYPVLSALHPEINFAFTVHFLKDGVVRMKMDQVGERYGGWKRYDEAGKWAFVDEDGNETVRPAQKGEVKVQAKESVTVATFGPSDSYSLELQHSPFKATFFRDGKPQAIVNDRALLHMEHFRAKEDKEKDNIKVEDSEKEGDDAESKLIFQKRSAFEKAGHAASLAEAWAGFEKPDSGEWEETWAKKQDSKPKGPEALSLDISFPGKDFIFGLPEHASPLNLRSTRGEKKEDYEQPYRLMNTDVFEYEYDSPMALYGSVPIVHAQSAASGAVSAFFLSGAETWIDINRAGSTAQTHWIAESGILDVMIFLGDTPAKNIETFTALVGRSTAPQTFALGYHQCRWNYLTDADVLTVQKRFDEDDIPMDVMWLDIEYSKDHMYGVWDELKFLEPEKMIDELDVHGRKLVIIIDPHLKRTSSYWLYEEAKQNELLVRTKGGKDDYEGWCWPGSSSWLDMFNPLATTWWKKQFTLDAKTHKGKIVANRRNMHIWNDMSEPAIFDGPEITSPKDVVHHGSWEHRDIHNINGLLFQAATYFGLREREGADFALQRRPFVLSRAWWVGTQKYGAIWTGDNLGTWEHLAVSVPMILANNIAGMSFCGADIGGFFGNPSPEMLLRWYQTGIFEPFFRAHAHIDTKRREPFLFDEPYKSHVRDLIRLRYQLLPVWTTAFREASNEGSGLPVLRPQFLMFPKDTKGFAIDDQYYLGDSGLLVKPPVHEGIEKVGMYLSDDEPYYSYFTHEIYRGANSPYKNRTVDVPAPLDSTLPLLHRGGSILPLRRRVRRAAELGWKDPVSLVVALNKGSDGDVRAQGSLYLDDGQTYQYKAGAFLWRRFTLQQVDAKKYVLSSRDEGQLRSSASSSSSSSSISISDATAVTVAPAYDPSNEFATAMKDVRVDQVTLLGLDFAPATKLKITVSGDVIPPSSSSSTSSGGSSGSGSASEGLSYTWTAGQSASDAGRKHGKGENKASELVIKDPRGRIGADWDVVIEVV